MKTLKALIFTLAIPALLLALAGCKEPGAETNPPTNITVTKLDGNTLTGTLTLAVDEEVELRVSATGATSYDWDVDESGKVELVGNANGATATFKGISEGSASIYAYARNADGFISKTIPVTVTPKVPAPGTLVLTVSSDNVGTWSNNNTLTILPDDNLTLAVTGKVDNEDVDLTSTEWEVTGETGVVTIDETTGEVTVVKPGTTEITVTADAAEAEEDATKTITLVVERVYDDDVIFEWHLDELSFAAFIASQDNPATISNPANGTPGANGDPCIPLSSAGGVRHPDFSGITLRSYGAQIPYNTYTGEKGFRLGGYTNAGGPRFAIGQGSNQETATGVAPVGGQLNLLQRKVKVTVGYADIIDAANRYNLRIAVNNNTNSGGSSSLGTSSTIKTFIWGAASTDANHVKIETDAVSGTEFVKQGSSKAEGELYAIIDPSEFIGNAGLPSLQNAFIMLHAQNLSSAGTDMAAGNWITITYIKIEYTGGAVEMPDPIALTVMDGDTAVGSNIAMTLGDPAKTLTATVDPVDADITWEVTTGTSVTLSSLTGGSTNVTLTGTEGITTIKVTATKTDYITEIKTFTVTVGTDPNLIWTWSHATDGWTTINSNSNSTLKGKKVRNWGSLALASLPQSETETRKGVVMGTDGAHRFLIGSNSNTGSSTSVWDSTAEFNFSAAALNGKKVKITVVYDVLSNGTASSGNHQLRILINNNTVTSAGSIHSFDNSESRWYLEQKSIYETTPTPSIINQGPFTLEGTFDPTKAALLGTPAGTPTPTLEDVLKNSYVAIGMMANTGTVLISSIKIEYVVD